MALAEHTIELPTADCLMCPNPVIGYYRTRWGIRVPVIEAFCSEACHQAWREQQRKHAALESWHREREAAGLPPFP